MHNIAIIRLFDGELAWYPPGSSDGPRWLRLDAEQEALRAAIADRRLTPVFAVPGEDARLLTVTIAPEEKRHFARSLPYMLEEALAGDVADLHFAHCALDKLEYAVAVCSVSAMEAYRDRLQGFQGITQWLPEPLLLPWNEGEWSLVLEENGAIVRTGLCAGFSAERDLLPALLEAALREREPETIVVYGRDQAEDLALMPETLRERVQWRTGDLYAALLVAEQPRPLLNLRQGAFAQRLPLGRWWSQWRVAAALFGAGPWRCTCWRRGATIASCAKRISLCVRLSRRATARPTRVGRSRTWKNSCGASLTPSAAAARPAASSH